jgi:putative ABC transport system substrate-binding protein
MRRRELLAIVGGAAVSLSSWPVDARAQKPAIPVIGFLSLLSAEAGAERAAAFREGLKESGYVEGHNVAIEYRSAEGRFERLPELAADLVRRPVALIGAFGGAPAALAARAATTTIPVLFILGVDPVQYGLVTSLNRPGGNVTGITLLDAVLAPKHLQLVRELVPRTSLIAFLANPDNPNFESVSRAVQEAAVALGLNVLSLNARSEQEIARAITMSVQQRAGALIIGADPFFNGRLEQIAAQAARHSMPTLHSFRDFAVAGGLMSYGTSLADAYRQMGMYAGRILGGEKPADLPVLQPTKFEFVVNLKTAQRLNLEVPSSILLRADEVIR